MLIFLSFRFFLRQSWWGNGLKGQPNQYFSSESIVTSVFQPTENNIYFINTIFEVTNTATENGGAICIDNQGQSKMQMLFEYCTFYNCQTQNHGGGIYVNMNGIYSINKCCFEGCITQVKNTYSIGQSIYCSLKDDITYTHRITSSSFCSSEVKDKDSRSSLFVNYGKHIMEYLNVSYNYLYQIGAIHSEPTVSEGITSSLKYSHIEKDYVQKTIVLYFTSDSDAEIRACTILSNRVIDQREGIINAKKLTVSDSYIKFNVVSDYTFACTGSYIIVVNCSISQTDIMKTSGNVDISNYSPSSQFLLSFNLVDTLGCYKFSDYIPKTENERKYFEKRFIY